MVWAIIVCALVVLGLASFAGLGRLGEMPAEAVNDRPKGYIPDGPVTQALLKELRLPQASTGYAHGPVNGYLANIASGSALPAEQTRFPVVRGGYDMQVVDELIERPRYERPTAQPVEDAGVSTDTPRRAV